MPEKQVEMLEEGGVHWYKSPKKKNLWYPSVTSILSIWPKGEGFNRYLANQPSWEASQEVLQAAGKRGTRVHEATELLEVDKRILQKDMYTLEEWRFLIGFVAWRIGINWQIEYAELGIVSDKVKTGGTIDRIYRDGDIRRIVDFKTSSAIHKNYFVQVATYAEMYEQQYKVKIDEVGICRLAPRKKDGYEYKVMDRAEWKKQFKLFQNAQSIWNEINPDAQPTILTLPTTLSLS